VAPAPDLVAVTAERDSLKATAAENERTARYWYDQAHKGEPAKPAAEAKAEQVDLLDLITSQGEKGLKDYLKKQGFVSADEVDSKVNEKAAQLTSEAQLIKDYPDLNDAKSEFFLATAQFYGELKKDGVPERLAMKLAAQQAELAGIRGGKIKTPAQKTADETATRAEERRVRAAAGAGDHGGHRANEEADDIPTADEALAIQRLADALEIPLDKATERYKARAKKGVQVAMRLAR
jgi:hypothetical protein